MVHAMALGCLSSAGVHVWGWVGLSPELLFGGLLMETTQSGICLLLQLPEPGVKFLYPGTQIPVPLFTQVMGPQVPLSRAQFP